MPFLLPILWALSPRGFSWSLDGLVLRFLSLVKPFESIAKFVYLLRDFSGPHRLLVSNRLSPFWHCVCSTDTWYLKAPASFHLRGSRSYNPRTGLKFDDEVPSNLCPPSDEFPVVAFIPSPFVLSVLRRRSVCSCTLHITWQRY